jgi:hypothetical protein
VPADRDVKKFGRVVDDGTAAIMESAPTGGVLCGASEVVPTSAQNGGVTFLSAVAESVLPFSIATSPLVMCL